MYECGICKKKFPDHPALTEHIFAEHGNNVNWNSFIVWLWVCYA